MINTYDYELLDDSYGEKKEYKSSKDNDSEDYDYKINEHHDKKKKSKKYIIRNILKEILIDSVYILVVMALMLLVIKYVGQRTVVTGISMEKTLQDQDSLIVNKISYRFHEPERFDIIVFPFAHEKDTYYIKRVIGLPGETVRIDFDGNIFINDEPLSENFGTEKITDPGVAVNPITIGKDEYFVLGDNRNHSSDSRTIAVGLIKREKIIGKAIFRLYPFNKIGTLN